jgi:hypothetical protein
MLPINTIYEMTNSLLSVCDGAIRLDMEGFNKPDSLRVRNLLNYPKSEKIAKELSARLYKYRKQLRCLGFTEEQVSQLEKEKINKVSRKFIGFNGYNIMIKFPYDYDLIQLIKSSFRTRRWDNETKSWLIDISEYEKVIELFVNDFEIDIDSILKGIKKKEE